MIWLFIRRPVILWHKSKTRKLEDIWCMCTSFWLVNRAVCGSGWSGVFGAFSVLLWAKEWSETSVFGRKADVHQLHHLEESMNQWCRTIQRNWQAVVNWIKSLTKKKIRSSNPESTSHFGGIKQLAFTRFVTIPDPMWFHVTPRLGVVGAGPPPTCSEL